jgi:hypothetical protein
MKSPYFFVITPKGSEYDDEIEIAGKKITVNSSLEDHRHVNRFATVLSTPVHYEGDISPGDTIIVHHNVFRTYFDVKGRSKKSPNYFKDNLYFIDPFQFYVFHNGTEWRSVEDWCFVKPVDKENAYLYEDGYEEHTGILVYGNNRLEEIGVLPGQRVKFLKDSEYEFTIEGELLYRMNTKDIVAKV